MGGYNGKEPKLNYSYHFVCEQFYSTSEECDTIQGRYTMNGFMNLKLMNSDSPQKVFSTCEWLEGR